MGSESQQPKSNSKIPNSKEPENPSNPAYKHMDKNDSSLHKNQELEEFKRKDNEADDKSILYPIKEFMEDEELFVVRVILFICIILTLGTVIGIFCILYRRKPHRVAIKREDSSVLR